MQSCEYVYLHTFHITFLCPPIFFLMCVMFNFLSFHKKWTTRHLHHPSLYRPTTQSAASTVIFTQRLVGKISISERLLSKQSWTEAINLFINYQTKMIYKYHVYGFVNHIFRGKKNVNISTQMCSGFPAAYTEVKRHQDTSKYNEADSNFRYFLTSCKSIGAVQHLREV